MVLFKDLNKNLGSLLCTPLVLGHSGPRGPFCWLVRNSFVLQDEEGELAAAEAPACGQSPVLSICPTSSSLKVSIKISAAPSVMQLDANSQHKHPSSPGVLCLENAGGEEDHLKLGRRWEIKLM